MGFEPEHISVEPNGSFQIRNVTEDRIKVEFHFLRGCRQSSPFNSPHAAVLFSIALLRDRSAYIASSNALLSSSASGPVRRKISTVRAIMASSASEIRFSTRVQSVSRIAALNRGRQSSEFMCCEGGVSIELTRSFEWGKRRELLPFFRKDPNVLLSLSDREKGRGSKPIETIALDQTSCL
jgi:hypothetical protein